MMMKYRVILLVTVALGLGGGLLSPNLAQAVDVQSSVQLGAAATCGLQVIGGSPINYGQLAAANSNNPEPGVKLSIQNTGSTAKAAVTVKGTNWVGTASAGTVMDVKTTHFGIIPVGASTPPPYASKTPLSLTAVSLLPAGITVAAGAIQDSFWQVSFVLNGGVTYTGTASQTVTLDSTCQ